MDPGRFFAEELPRRLSGAPPCTVQIEVRGAGSWWVRTGGGRVESGAGQADRPTFTVAAELEDWRDLLDGAATLRACLIDGRVEVEGDLALATRVAPLIFGAR